VRTIFRGCRPSLSLFSIAMWVFSYLCGRPSANGGRAQSATSGYRYWKRGRMAAAKGIAAYAAAARTGCLSLPPPAADMGDGKCASADKSWRVLRSDLQSARGASSCSAIHCQLSGDTNDLRAASEGAPLPALHLTGLGTGVHCSPLHSTRHIPRQLKTGQNVRRHDLYRSNASMIKQKKKKKKKNS